VRGPLDALNLQPQVDSAEALLRIGDPRAVEEFAAIAERLQGTAFHLHATTMLRKHVEALQAVGREDEAIIARVGLVWGELDRAQAWEASFALLDAAGPGHQPELNASAERVLAAAEAAVWRARGADLERVVVAFDALDAKDPYRAHAAVFLVEEAIAAEQREIITDRLGLLRSIADEALADSDEVMRQRAARIRMCLADVTGEWADLLGEVYRRLPRGIVAWVYARWARSCALSGNGADAQYHYLEAIDYASTEGMFDEAADWLYALRTVGYLYGEFPSDEHSLAQALRPHSKPSTLPGSHHTGELALSARLDESAPKEALQRCQRWRWQAVVRADLAEESQAVQNIGTLLERLGDIEAAIQSYVRAGRYKKARAAARNLSDRPARIERSLLTSVSTTRTAAFAAAAAAADVLDDDEAREWTKEAMDEITRGDPVYALTQSASVQRAGDALASMCQVMSPEQATRLLQLIDSILNRPANGPLPTDPAMARILVCLSAHPLAPPLLAQAILAEQMAATIIARSDLLEAHRDLLMERLAPFAKDNRHACLAIIGSGADPAVTLELARTEIEKVLAPRPHLPNGFQLYGVSDQDAILASVLDQEIRNRFAITMLERALDHGEPMENRWNYLGGLYNIAPVIDQATKDHVLPRVLELARGDYVGQRLAFFDADIDLVSLALQCAVALRPEPSTCLEIEQIGMTQLRAADEPKQWGVTQALVLIPAENSRLNPGDCAVHPLAPVRALAAIRWAKDPAVLPLERAVDLARDADSGYGRLSQRLYGPPGTPMTDDTRQVVAILRQDVRRSVRTPALQIAVA
jgi:tetratricopeptide (TPR) repeat protein